jgi:hypothetical protein
MKNEIQSAINMHRFGINTLVMTQHKILVEIREKFLNDPDWSWCHGRGKKYLHGMLHKKLLAEDAYFESNIDEAVNTNQRWNDFMDDCAIFAVLDEVITQNPLLLLHPSCVENFQHPKMPPLKVKATIIDSIASIH